MIMSSLHSNGFYTSAATVRCHHLNVDQKVHFRVESTLRRPPSRLLNLCHEDLKQVWKQKGIQPNTNKTQLKEVADECMQ